VRRSVTWLVLLIGWLLVTAAPAAANSAPPRWTGDKPGVVLPGSTSQVHVTGEKLQFTLADDLRTANVTAHYELENRGTALTGFPVVFVIQDVAAGDRTVTVTWNGQLVNAEPISQHELSAAQADEMNKAWTAMKTVIDPVTAQRYDFNSFGSPAMRYVEFGLDLPAQGKGALEVLFQQAAGTDWSRHVNAIYHYQYLLLPAKGWASIGPLEIAVKAPPAGQVFFASTLPLQRQGDEYRVTLPGLPKENLAFAVMSRRGLIGGIADPGPYYWMVFALALVGAAAVGYGLGRLARLVRARGWAVAVGILLGVVVGGVADLLIIFGLIGMMPALANQSYGNVFVGVGQALVAIIMTTVVSGISARHKTI
jgi:hypothetical protein